MRIDVHQHIWTTPLLDALAQRDRLPFVRRSDGLTVLHSADEHPYLIDAESEAPHRRAELLRSDGLDRALIAISSPIGIEALPRDEALELIEAHLAGVSSLSEEFGMWGPLPLDRPEPDDVDHLLARGCLGISPRLSRLRADLGRSRRQRLGDLLERGSGHRFPRPR